MTEITPVLGVDPAELRKAVKVIGRLLNDKSLVALAEQGSTQDLVYVIGHRVYTDKCPRPVHEGTLNEIKNNPWSDHHKHHCKCHHEAAKLNDISSLLEGIEDVLVLKALLDLRADPDKRLSVWKDNQTANDIIRNKTNVLLTAGVVDAKEQTKLAESEKTPSTKQNTKPEQEVIKVDPNKVLIIEDEDTHNQIRIYVDVKESKTHD